MTNHKTLSLLFIALAMVSLLAGPATARSLFTGSDVRNSSLTGLDIKDRSLSEADFRGSVRGPAGLVDIRAVSSSTISVPPGQTTYDVAPSDWQANCPSGYTVIGTGFSANFGDMWSVESYDTFVGGFGSNSASVPADFSIQAICAKLTGGASAATLKTSTTTERQRYAADLREMEARHQH